MHLAFKHDIEAAAISRPTRAHCAVINILGGPSLVALPFVIAQCRP
jgi:hypothetical protein